jgi:hypothetical protein
LFRCPVIGKPLSSAGVDFEGNCRVQNIIVSTRMNTRMNLEPGVNGASYKKPQVTAAGRGVATRETTGRTGRAGLPNHFRQICLK